MGISSTELSMILKDLIEYAETHFRAEEAIMRECGYQDLSAQENAHRHYTIEVRRFITRINENWFNFPDDLFVFLKSWWQEHIIKMDKKYSPFLGQLKEPDKIHQAAMDNLRLIL
ncbi:MAG: hemerythrin family protein [Deltaproteobacteria bacterium]|nr:hemerythrin family protein [Deltaproteobacteria bacterium]